MGGTPSALVLSPDGSRLAVLVEATRSKCGTQAGGTRYRLDEGALDGASTLAFSPDQQLLVVGRTTSIDILQAESGGWTSHLTDVVNRHLGSAVDKRWISFSPDGVWLASTQSDDVLRLVDYRNDRPAPEVPAEGVIGFAVAAGGDHIVTVAPYPLLRARVMELRNERVDPTEPDRHAACRRSRCRLDRCLFPRPGTLDTARSKRPRLRATLRTVDALGNGRHRLEPGRPRLCGVLPSEDVIVGLSGRLRYPHQGGAPETGGDDKSRTVSVSETGRRVALIDEDHQVRVYSLADDKPFLSPLEGDALAVSRWRLDRHTQSAGPGRAIGHRGDQARGRRAVGSTPPDPHPPRRATEPHLRGENALIAVLKTEPTSSVVLDITTGRPRFARLPGVAEPLGERREMLLVRSGDAFQIVRTRDGASVAPRDQRPAGVKSVPSSVLVSPKGQAIAVLTEALPAQGTRRITARAYAVRGENLDLVAEAHDLPMESLVGLRRRPIQSHRRRSDHHLRVQPALGHDRRAGIHRESRGPAVPGRDRRAPAQSIEPFRDPAEPIRAHPERTAPARLPLVHSSTARQPRRHQAVPEQQRPACVQQRRSLAGAVGHQNGRGARPRERRDGDEADLPQGHHARRRHFRSRQCHPARGADGPRKRAPSSCRWPTE